jgi:signal peptidase I
VTQTGGSPPTSPPGPEPQPERQKQHSSLRNGLEWVVIIAAALLVAFLVKTFLLQAFYIPSESMMPTLKPNDRVLVNKLSYDLHDVNRGDLVVFESPNTPDGAEVRDLIKRVIAVEGDTVEARDGHLILNGQPLTEPYLGPDVSTGPMERVTVPDDHVWVMGDNRPNSKDSRFFGPLPESKIIGRAFVRVWPIPSFRLL